MVALFIVNSRVDREKIMRIKENEAYGMVLVGNKCDLDRERQVSFKEGEAIAKSWGVPFFESSAKDDKNVAESIHALVGNIDDSRSARGSGKKARGGCCSVL